MTASVMLEATINLVRGCLSWDGVFVMLQLSAQFLCTFVLVACALLRAFRFDLVDISAKFLIRCLLFNGCSQIRREFFPTIVDIGIEYDQQQISLAASDSKSTGSAVYSRVPTTDPSSLYSAASGGFSGGLKSSPMTRGLGGTVDEISGAAGYQPTDYGATTCGGVNVTATLDCGGGNGVSGVTTGGGLHTTAHSTSLFHRDQRSPSGKLLRSHGVVL